MDTIIAQGVAESPEFTCDVGHEMFIPLTLPLPPGDRECRGKPGPQRVHGFAFAAFRLRSGELRRDKLREIPSPVTHSGSISVVVNCGCVSVNHRHERHAIQPFVSRQGAKNAKGIAPLYLQPSSSDRREGPPPLAEAFRFIGTLGGVLEQGEQTSLFSMLDAPPVAFSAILI
jgi:hypothetical protein